jgi:hypothetical protein
MIKYVRLDSKLFPDFHEHWIATFYDENHKEIKDQTWSLEAQENSQGNWIELKIGE